MLLVDLGITKQECITLLQFCITRSIVLLKISPCDVWINSFEKKVPSLRQANIDAQFILDAYVAATYSSSYITKIDLSMTTAFKQI